MKIFLSWSGPRSRAVADALSTWIPRVIQAVDVFFSPDIEKGAKWGNEITGALEGTSFGIVVITRDNLGSPWLHYEAGALSKLADARVWTFLVDVTNANVPPPLGLFQNTEATQGDVLKLMRSINAQVRERGEKALTDVVLDETFEDQWPRFKSRLEDARSMKLEIADSPITPLAPTSPERSERHMLEELLELARAQQRLIVAHPQQAPALQGRHRYGTTASAVTDFTVHLVGTVDLDEFVRHIDRSLPVRSWWSDTNPGGRLRTIGVNLVAAAGQELIQEAIDIAAHNTGVRKSPQWSLISYSLSPPSVTRPSDAAIGDDGFSLPA